MKLIILAAGMGSRLAPLTDNIPKCMVELKGKPLILWQIELAKKVGIKDIIVVRGYKGEKLDFLEKQGIKLIDNFEYASTNMVETLFRAEEDFGDEFIISYGDIVYEEEVLKKICKSENDITVAIDNGWEEYWKMRNEDIFSDAESLVLNGENIVNIGEKVTDIKFIQGQYIGLLKFKQNGINALKNIYQIEKEAYLQNKNYISNERKLNQLYMTDLIQGLINQGNEVKKCDIFRKWLEIDNVDDLKLAEQLTSVSNSLLYIK